MRQLLPLGSSDFASIREEKQYYIDKSMLIKEVSDISKVTLITRPRRFGKTLGMSMIRHFYDHNRDNRHLFEGLAIMKEKEFCEQKMGKHPVIFLSFKDIKRSNWADASNELCDMVYGECIRHRYLLDSNENDEPDAELFQNIITKKSTPLEIAKGLRVLTKMLHLYHGSKVVVLIDEYDTPIISAWLEGYYKEAVDFMRTLFGSTFKDNDSLEKGVMTGILRVAKESLFSGLNNFAVCSVLEKPLNDKFGFTDEEVAQLLTDYGLNGKHLQDVREWYNGYNYWGVTIYNPWSLLSYISEGIDFPVPYWVNTGDDPLLKTCMLTGTQNIRDYMQRLIEGEKIHLPLNKYLVFSELETDVNAVWNLLLFAGYLKVENVQIESTILFGDVSIPNLEISSVYRTKIKSWLADGIGSSQLHDMLKAMLGGDEESFAFFFTGFIERLVSVYDVASHQSENFYHAFLLGLFVNLERDYVVKSNRESGLGRYDIAVIPKQSGKPGVVFELKTPSRAKKQTIDDAMAKAEEQMLLRRYDTELLQHGANPIHRFAIAVQGKEALVKLII